MRPMARSESRMRPKGGRFFGSASQHTLVRVRVRVRDRVRVRVRVRVRLRLRVRLLRVPAHLDKPLERLRERGGQIGPLVAVDRGEGDLHRVHACVVSITIAIVSRAIVSRSIVSRAIVICIASMPAYGLSEVRHISPISRPYLAYISLYLAYISPTSPLHLPYISACVRPLRGEAFGE